MKNISTPCLLKKLFRDNGLEDGRVFGIQLVHKLYFDWSEAPCCAWSSCACDIGRDGADARHALARLPGCTCRSAGGVMNDEDKKKKWHAPDGVLNAIDILKCQGYLSSGPELGLDRPSQICWLGLDRFIIRNSSAVMSHPSCEYAATPEGVSARCSRACSEAENERLRAENERLRAEVDVGLGTLEAENERLQAELKNIEYWFPEFAVVSTIEEAPLVLS